MSSPNMESVSYLSPKEIEAYLKKIADEKSLYGELLEGLDCGVGATDGEGRLICCNRKFLTLLGHQVSKRDAPFYARVQNGNLKAFFQKSLSVRTFCEGEFKIGGSPNLSFLSIFGFAVLDDGYAFAVRDVTDSKRRLLEMKRLESLAAVGNVSAVLAHDINNPLSAVYVQAELIRRRADEAGDGFIAEHVEIIKSEIERIRRTVQGFLRSARPLDAVMLLQDPEKLIDDAIRLVRPDLESKGISLICDITRPLPYIEFDFDLMHSCLINLIKNAMEAIGDKSGRREISVSAARRYNSLVIAIEDTGCGISDEDADRIFKPYFTTKAFGTGLGLSDAYKIVKMHSGDIEVQRLEEAEKGVRVSIVLPLRSEDRLALDDAREKG